MIGLLLEAMLSAAVVAAVVLWGVDASVDGALQSAAGLSGTAERTAAAVRAAAETAKLQYALGIGAMLLGRLVGGVLGRDARISAPLLVPAVAAMSGLGLVLQWGYSDPIHASAAFFYGPAFAPGVLMGGVVAGLLMAVPWQPGEWAVRGRWVVGGGAALLMAALALFGDAPGSSGARINLLGVQPIEVVKLAFVVFLAASLGRNVAQLRHQRVRLGWIHWPRLTLLVPALGLTLALFALMFFVKDLGPTLILSAVLVAFYLAVVRSWIEVALLAAAVLAGGLLVVVSPPLFLPDNVAVRADMLRDPWLNGHVGGDQLAAGLWAMAAGGLDGQGWGKGAFGMLPAGHTDLILAHLTEVAGLQGLLGYTAALLLLVAQALWIGARSRTPERALLAYGIGALLVAQWAIIFAGTLGLIPLTGVVVPYLSFGKSSMILFLAAAGLLGRLAADGRLRAETDELQELRGGLLTFGALAAGLALLLGTLAGGRVLLQGPGISTQGVLTVGWDDTVFFRYDPRIRAIARQIPRGEIRDRMGEVLAGNDETLRRTYPLGDDLGTLIGPSLGGVARPSWSVEGMFDAHLRGLADIAEPLAVYIEKRPDVVDPQTGAVTRRRTDRILFTVNTDTLEDSDLRRARRQIDDGSEVLFTRVARVDYSSLVRVLHLKGQKRERAIQKLAEAIDARSVQLTLDARLQRKAAELAKKQAAAGKAAAVVVIDVDSGEVLARAQWPDYDPGQPDAWRSDLLSNDARFMGSYGPWRDKTGMGGLYQAGSVFKVATALAAVRADNIAVSGHRCALREGPTYDCRIGAECRGRPCVDRPGWSQPIHDGHSKADGADVDLVSALEVSCNVYFAQLGLDIGPQGFTDLVAAGLEVDAGNFSPGAAGSHMLASTAYGQGAARMHTLQAARMVATVASGGVYRRCPASMLKGAPCEEHRIVDAAGVQPILSGMKKVIEEGTARSFQDLEGVRVYGKTGTATDPGRSDEVPYGIRRGSDANSHSWFVAIAEPGSVDPCEPEVGGRLAVAAVVPRGGGGSGAARLITEGIIAEARRIGYLSR